MEMDMKEPTVLLRDMRKKETIDKKKLREANAKIRIMAEMLGPEAVAFAEA